MGTLKDGPLSYLNDELKTPSKTTSFHIIIISKRIKDDLVACVFFLGRRKLHSELLCLESFLIPVTPALGPLKHH